METRRINYEDDIVMVINPHGDIIYEGMEDYEPMKREPWKWLENEGVYKTMGADGVYTKICKA